MYLHNNPSDLASLLEIVEASGRFPFANAYIEKDYYLTMILKEFVRLCPDIVFKGGTSLSKGYKVINRFSEDIDLTSEKHFSERDRRNFKHGVVDTVIQNMGLTVPGSDIERYKRKFTRYNFLYTPLADYVGSAVKPEVKTEIVFFIQAYPVEVLPIQSFLGQYLSETNPQLMWKYGLEPFNIKIQHITRTFIDKVFAICDYYKQDRRNRASRHIYDLYFIAQYFVSIGYNCSNAEFRQLIQQVRQDRRINSNNAPTADPRINIADILKEIYGSRVFEEDYYNTTVKMAINAPSYDTAASVLPRIYNSGLFGPIPHNDIIITR